MNPTLKVILLAVILTIATSRLILPSDIPAISLKNKQSLKSVKKDFLQARSAASTANPVGNIPNATAGYLSVDDPDNESKLFYTFYSCSGLKNGQTAKDVPIVIWLQGGPGASSFMGSFMEFGPYRLEKDSKGEYHEVKNEKSWNDHYNLLIVDNPRGTGYSVADKNSYVTGQDEVANDFLNALLNFYKLSAYSTFKQTPLYIFGESYGGHYIPSISKRIIEYNRGKPSLPVPLAGIGIGDGWTDPIHQLASYGMFGFSLGFLDYVERDTVELNQLIGIGNILKGNYAAALNQFDTVVDTIRRGSGDVNIYNFRIFGDYDTSCLDKFFNNPANARRYSVDNNRIGTYQDENEGVYNGLRNDFMKSVADRVAFVADSGLPVLLYNGQYDVIVNTPTAINWIGQMKWSGQSNFYNAPLQNWLLSNGSVAGLAKNYNNFTFVIMNKAGHMAPMDQYDASVDMLQRFTQGEHKWNQTLTHDEAISI